MEEKPLSEVRRDPGYCILLPGGRMYFDKNKRYSWTYVGAALRCMFPGPAQGGVPTRLPLRGYLEDKLIPRFGTDELFLHYGENV